MQVKDTELKRLRDRDLYRAFTQSLRERSFSSTSEAVDCARLRPAPQYYISARTASLLIGRIENHMSLVDLNSNSRRRIWRIYNEYQNYLKEHPGCHMPREIILEEIVESPAPEFYVSHDRAKHIILHERKEARKRIGLKR